MPSLIVEIVLSQAPATQVELLEQLTVGTCPTPVGSSSDCQLPPPFEVDTIVEFAVTIPLFPTATQVSDVEHEISVRFTAVVGGD
jgi:hypothetical protein